MRRELKKSDIVSLTKVIIGSFMMATGIDLFISPHNLAFGGVTGISIILQSVFNVPLYCSSFVLSVTITLIGWKELGLSFMSKTLLPTTLLPVLIFAFGPLKLYSVGLLESVIAGGIIIGIGIGLIIVGGGSTAGPDTIGLILNRKFRVPIALTMLIIDAIVIMCGFQIYGLTTAMLSVCVSAIMNLTVKKVVDLLL